MWVVLRRSWSCCGVGQISVWQGRRCAAWYGGDGGEGCQELTGGHPGAIQRGEQVLVLGEGGTEALEKCLCCSVSESSWITGEDGAELCQEFCCAGRSGCASQYSVPGLLSFSLSNRQVNRKGQEGSKENKPVLKLNCQFYLNVFK